MTVLMYAIKAGLEGLCYKLIELGADIHAKDEYVPPLSGIWHSSATHSSLTLCAHRGFRLQSSWRSVRTFRPTPNAVLSYAKLVLTLIGGLWGPRFATFPGSK